MNISIISHSLLFLCGEECLLRVKFDAVNRPIIKFASCTRQHLWPRYVVTLPWVESSAEETDFVQSSELCLL